MKLGLISDIHGDVVALELAWAHLTVLGADRIICAGDLVGYGPLPDRVVAFLAEHGIDSVMGNHDEWATERRPSQPDPFHGGTPSPETIEILRALPFDRVIPLGNDVGVITHGAPGDNMEFLTRSNYPPERLRRLLHDLDANLLVVGHTHQPMWYQCERGLVINPGSVISAPVVKTSRTFALLDWDTRAVTFHDVESGSAVEVKPWRDESDEG